MHHQCARFLEDQSVNAHPGVIGVVYESAKGLLSIPLCKGSFSIYVLVGDAHWKSDLIFDPKLGP